MGKQKAMLSRKQYLTLHAAFYDNFMNSASRVDRYLPYDEYVIPSGVANGSEWITFHSSTKELIKELLNTINQFYTDLKKLESWNYVLNKCEEVSRTDLILEIIDPLTSSIINSIYLIKQRFIYASCMLLHQTEMLMTPEMDDSKLSESEICYETLVSYRNSYSGFDAFTHQLTKIDDYSFRKRTLNYRNLFQHHIPPSVENGLSRQIYNVADENEHSSLSIGGVTPIHINNIMPILDQQHHACTDTFGAFWGLVSEQVLMWKILRPNSP
jgi:hypothetical protein